jgi:mono/diheme cytochrome c family protein
VRALALVTCLLVASCRQDMHDQPRFEPMEASSFFADGRSARPQVDGTVARGELRLDDHLYRGTVGGRPAMTFPFEVTAEVLERGRERYDIFCSTCHDRTGSGEGLVVQRGLKRPPSFHIDRLREAPPGYFFDVMTRGFGAMYDMADRIDAEDRWAITAYVRALQLSQNATLMDVPPGWRAALEDRR